MGMTANGGNTLRGLSRINVSAQTQDALSELGCTHRVHTMSATSPINWTDHRKHP